MRYSFSFLSKHRLTCRGWCFFVYKIIKFHGGGGVELKLTEKQQRFADEYIRTGNATESAIIAGYSPKTARFIGSENLTKPHIKAYVDKELNKMSAKRVMNATEAMELLTEIARGEMQETIYMSTPVGVEEINKLPDINQRTSALKEILKRYPIDKDHVDKEQLLRLKRMELEIEKLEQEVKPEADTEDTLKKYFEKLGSAIDES